MLSAYFYQLWIGLPSGSLVQQLLCIAFNGPRILNSLTILLRQFNDDALHFGVSLQSILAQFTADTRLLESAERSLRLQHVVAIDPVQSNSFINEPHTKQQLNQFHSTNLILIQS